MSGHMTGHMTGQMTTGQDTGGVIGDGRDLIADLPGKEAELTQLIKTVTTHQISPPPPPPLHTSRETRIEIEIGESLL